ncbi:MAG: phosphoribosylamine--glycine ligase N-terminal domain-containing protein, partial [Anaerolineae bacterium]
MDDATKRTILIVGSGGREHALAWKLAQSAQVGQIWVAPGNGGTAGVGVIQNVALDAADGPALLAFAQSHAVDLTVVGPEAPLAAGIVDLFQAAGLRIFGPTQAAA